SVSPWLESASGPVAPLVERILEETGYAEYVARTAGSDAGARLETIDEFLGVAREFDASYEPREFDPEAEQPVNPLVTFLEQLALSSEVDALGEEPLRAVTLMTVHNSKGLEFDHVILTGMEEGLFPHARSAEQTEAGIQEERRLCYVGMTRARKTLTLTHARCRRLHGSVQHARPSRFLDEIPDRLVVRQVSKQLVEGWPVPADFETDRGPARLPGAQAASEGDRLYRVGMRVCHPMFGEGTIRSCQQSGGDAKLVIHFRRGGEKKLIARYARLQILDSGQRQK
ncbi:MAG: ATP-dependent DNA helicase PcrA, partial [Candidatus Dadabacteria bacterium]